MGEPEGTDGRTIDFFNYLVERLRKVEAENEELRTSEGSLRAYLENQLSEFEDTEREAQYLRELLYPTPQSEVDDGKHE